MRQFVRHPSDIPIAYSFAKDCDFIHPNPLKDIGLGGVCFCCEHELPVGECIYIEIPVNSPPFKAKGQIVWCLPEQGQFAIGVEFKDKATQYAIRMVEQVCHIEHYRKEVLIAEGRELTSELAAVEWIDKYAGSFPRG